MVNEMRYFDSLSNDSQYGPDTITFLLIVAIHDRRECYCDITRYVIPIFIPAFRSIPNVFSQYYMRKKSQFRSFLD